MSESSHYPIHDVTHTDIAGGRDLYCAWPWLGSVHNFGDGEVVITYTEKPCAYQTREDLARGNPQMRLVLRRTLDGGRTWPEQYRQVLRDSQEPLDEWLRRDGSPEPLDLRGPDAMLQFWRGLPGEEARAPSGQTYHRPVAFGLRSTDRGYHWPGAPVVVPRYHMDDLWGCTSYVKLPDGDILAGFWGHRSPPPAPIRSVVYVSRDQGLNWYYLSTVGYEDRDGGDCSYPALLRLPSGRVLCSLGYRVPASGLGAPSWTALTYSDDAGRTWAEPRRINALGDQAHLTRLRDGRIVCVFAYRFVPYGIRGIVSEDDGRTWSREFVIRSDGAGLDLGYPVVTELPDGRILAVYYFNVADDVDARLLNGGRRFVAASAFRLG